MRKYAIKLNQSYFQDGMAADNLADAKLFDSVQEANDQRSICNDYWQAQGQIVKVEEVSTLVDSPLY